MIVELQIAGDRFGTLVRESVKKELMKTCLTQSLTMAGFYLDRITFSDVKLVKSPKIIYKPCQDNNPNGAFVFVEQKTHWAYVKASTLTATKNGAAPKPDKTIEVTLVFALSLDTTSGINLEVCLASATSTDPDGPNFGVLVIVTPVSSTNLDDMATGIEKLLESPVPVLDGRIAADASLSRVALRLDVGKQSLSESSWASFSQGIFDDHLNGQNWSLLLDKELIVQGAIKRVKDGLAQAKGQFDLLSGPTGKFTTSGGTALVVVSFLGEAIDACECLGTLILSGGKDSKIDLNVDVSAVADFQVVEPNILQMTTEIKYWPDELESTCCEISAIYFWPLVGALYLESGLVGWYEYLGGILFPVIGPFIGLLLADTTPPLPIPADCSWVSKDDLLFVCKQKFPPFSEKLGKLNLLSASGVNEGLVLAGTLDIAEASLPELGTVNIVSFGFKYRGCPPGPGSWEAAIFLSNKGAMPLTICPPIKIDDANNYFVVETAMSGSVGHIYITAPNLAAQDGIPYPCKLIIPTNGGIRFVSLPAVAPLSQAEDMSLQLQAINDCINNTYKWVDPKSRWIKIPEPDPPYIDLGIRFVDVLMLGLSPADVVNLYLGDRLIANAKPDRPGSVHFTVLSPYDQGAEELGIERLIAGKGSATGAVRSSEIDKLPDPDGAYGMYIAQALLEPEAGFALDGKGNFISAGHYQGVPALLVATSTRLHVFDIEVPRLARLVHQFSAPSLRGAIPFQDGILGWGDAGLLFFSMDDGRRLTRLGVIEKPILDLVLSGDQLYALTGQGVDIYRIKAGGSNDPLMSWIERQSGEAASPILLEKQDQLSVEGASHLVLINDMLVVSKPRELITFDLSDPSRRKRVIKHDVQDVAGLEGSHSVIFPEAVYIHNARGGANVVDLSGEGAMKTQPLASFVENPWFMDGVKIGRVLARLEEDHRILRIYSLAAASRLEALDAPDLRQEWERLKKRVADAPADKLKGN